MLRDIFCLFCFLYVLPAFLGGQVAFQLAFSEKKYIHDCRVFWVFVYFRVSRFAFFVDFYQCICVFVSKFRLSIKNLVF